MKSEITLPAAKLRALMKAPGPILCAGIYDCLSAKVAERAGAVR